MDYSISLNGIFAAERGLEQVARRLATPKPAPDIAADLVEAEQAKIAGQANLKVLSIALGLQGSILDLFA